MSRPLVAVTATSEIIRELPRARLNMAYIAAIEGAGLMPLVTPPVRDVASADDLLSRVDGLVLTGGEDVPPRHYAAPRHPATEPPHAPRDDWELALIAAARRRAIPILAICRGMQILNVALGGTLVQDLPSERPGAIAHSRPRARGERVHAATLTPRCRTARALGSPEIEVNSSHHQAVDRIGEGLRIVGHSSDGIIEAIESIDDAWWVVGAQWHPEELVGTPEPWDRNLFAAFAAEVAHTRVTGRTRVTSQPARV